MLDGRSAVIQVCPSQAKVDQLARGRVDFRRLDLSFPGRLSLWGHALN